MRKVIITQPRLDCTSIERVKLNLNCRDEIIPVLRRLQHLYSQHTLRDEILSLSRTGLFGNTTATIADERGFDLSALGLGRGATGLQNGRRHHA